MPALADNQNVSFGEPCTCHTIVPGRCKGFIKLSRVHGMAVAMVVSVKLNANYVCTRVRRAAALPQLIALCKVCMSGGSIAHPCCAVPAGLAQLYG